MASLIPIVKLKAILDGMIEFIRADYEEKVATTTEEDSLLYIILEGNSEDGYDFFTEAKNIFLRDSTSPRKISTRLMFSKDVAPTPTIHVREPSAVKGTYNSIGSLNATTYIYEDSASGEYRDTKKSMFEYVITSDNPLDTILISEVIYSVMLSGYETFSTQLFETFDFQMKELIANQNVIPYPLFIKSIEMVAQFENTVKGINTQQFCQSLSFAAAQIYNKNDP